MHIADQDPLEEGDGPIAIIMTPTRKLCLQIWKECRKFVKTINARAVCVYRGTGISVQIVELISCTSLHGCIDQYYDMDSTITAFKQRKFQILVATRVAARGWRLRTWCWW